MLEIREGWDEIYSHLFLFYGDLLDAIESLSPGSPLPKISHFIIVSLEMDQPGVWRWKCFDYCYMKNTSIVFRMLPERGHHNATFYFSKILQENGYQVIYASIEKLRSYIESNGFSFYTIPESEDPAIYTKTKESGVAIFFFQFIKKVFRTGLTWTRFFINNHNYLLDIKRDLNPDLVIVDRCYGQMALNAIALQMNVFQAETTVSTNKVRGVPPLISYYLPTFSQSSIFLSELKWIAIFIKRKLNAILYGDFNSIVLEYAKKINYPPENINFKRDQNPGFDSIPELIFSPEEFDFPRQSASNQYYVGPSIFEGRKEDHPNHEFINPFKGQEKPLVYCALGALSYRYKGIEKFFSRLIEVFNTRKEYNLIVCVSNDVLRHKLMKGRKSNMFFFKSVPQLTLLKEVDLMINHGGMNSITECILSEVPMLIYPGSNFLDQNGNSARVVFHGIGLRGRLANEKVKDMILKIDCLIQNSSFKRNINLMKSKIYAKGNYNNGLSLVQSTLKEIVCI